MIRPLLASTLALAVLAISPQPASAKRGAPACGATYLPFYEGQVFEYEWLAPEAIVVGDAAPAGPKGPQADWPLSLRIEVKGIKGDKKAATITLVETYRKVSVETEITCDEGGFRIAPESFFFAGEPGGGLGMTLSKVKQDEVGLPSQRDFRTGLEWTSYITADVKREAKNPEALEVTNGKIEIDRKLAIRGKELIDSGLGQERAFRLDVELSGRAAVEPAMDKWRELPPGAVTLWFAPNNGLVRVHNRHGHGWSLKTITYAEE